MAEISGKGEHGYGLTLRNLSNDIRRKYNILSKKGSFVADVQPNSPADRAGLQRGTVITTVIIQNSRGKSIYFDDITPKKFKSLSKKHQKLTLQIEFQGMKYVQRLRK